MAVDDHGLEVLKKAGEEVTPGDKSDYYIKTGILLDGEPVSGSNPLPISGTFNVSTVPNTAGVQGAISVPPATATPVRVGASNLANRMALTALNNGNATLYWGYDTSTNHNNGTPLFRNQLLFLDVGPAITVYIYAITGTHDVRVTEVS